VKKEKVLRHNGECVVVSPWALTWDDENYYMIGYDHISGIVKHYRVDKMLNIRLTEEKRDGADLFKDFDMALYSKATFGMYGGKEQTVSLRCNNRLAGVMIDRFGTNLPFTNITDTHFEIRINVHTSPLFYSWLMSFGADITILSPGEVIDDYKALARAGLDRYT
jgi:predicted DNA-binding transcriptional regulator YafY